MNDKKSLCEDCENGWIYKRINSENNEKHHFRCCLYPDLHDHEIPFTIECNQFKNKYPKMVFCDTPGCCGHWLKEDCLIRPCKDYELKKLKTAKQLKELTDNE